MIDPEALAPYCGGCSAFVPLPISTSGEMLSRVRDERFQCRTSDSTHIAAVAKGRAGRLWLRVESCLAKLEARGTPMRWLQGRVLPRHNAGAYLMFRSLALVGLLAGVSLVEWQSSRWFRVTALVLAGLFIYDIVVVNTVTALIRRNAANSLRSAIFLLVAFANMAIAFAVLYLCSGALFTDLDQRSTGAVYFSVATMATAGLAALNEHDVRRPIAEMLVVAHLLLTFYFVALVIATVIGKANVSEAPPSLENLLLSADPRR